MFDFLFKKTSKKTNPKTYSVNVTQFDGNFLDEEDVKEISKIFYKSDDDLDYLKTIINEAKNKYPDQGKLKAKQNPKLKKLLAQSVNLAKRKETIPEAITTLEKAFQLDKTLKQLTLYHYRRMPTYHYKLKQYDEGFSWASRLTLGIPCQAPESTADWFDYYSHVLNLMAELQLSEPNKKTHFDAFGKAIDSIFQRYKSALLRRKQAKTLLLHSFINTDDIARYLSLNKVTSYVPMIKPTKWYEAYHEANYVYLSIYWDIDSSEHLVADLRSTNSAQWKTLRNVLKKIKCADITEELIADLASSLKGKSWQDHFKNNVTKWLDYISEKSSINLNHSFINELK